MKKPFIGVFPDFGDKTLYLTYDYDWFADDMNLSIVS